MKMRVVMIAFVVVGSLFGTGQGAFAGPFEDGDTAYYRGDYARALRLWLPLAEQGNADAQYNIGSMYQWGFGVPRDVVRAYAWINLSLRPYSVVGEADWPKEKRKKNFRDEIQKTMTAMQINQAQAMLTECSKSLFRSCGLHIPIEKPSTPTLDVSISVPMKNEGGTYIVPVLINNAITLNFVVDSGASDVSIPADVVMTLVRAGTLSSSDFIGTQTYQLADGSKMPSTTFRIRSLKVGHKIVENVTGSIAPIQGSLLLGQSFLSRFRSWSIDNATHALLLNE